MRITLVLLLAVAVAAATFVAVRRAADDDADSAKGAVTLIGDSLNVGVEPYLEDALPGWRVDAHDEVGRARRSPCRGDNLKDDSRDGLVRHDPVGRHVEYVRVRSGVRHELAYGCEPVVGGDREHLAVWIRGASRNFVEAIAALHQVQAGEAGVARRLSIR